TMGGNDDEAGSSRSKHSRQYETVEDVLLPQVHHEFLIWEGCNREVKSRMRCDGEIDEMLRIKLHEAGSNEEIFTSMVWIRAFNINEPIYLELCHEFYSTYEFDEVYVDDELQTKKIIKFRLGGHAHSLTLLEFACRLGLYHAEELNEEVEKENLSLNLGLKLYYPKPTVLRHQNGYANVAWLIARWIKRKGAGTQKESQICYGQFIMKLARKARVLSDEVIRSLSALIYCRDLDTTTLRELIDSKDHNLWDIIVNGDLGDDATPLGEQSSPPVPKTAKQLAARRNQERIKSILLLAIPDEYLLKFHNVPDAKSLWFTIKSRFGGNEESKKMQKNVLKHQFGNFVTASNETLDKDYDRF
ncbi:hypothetical protein Tco_1242529, partial [Tanacetum coccineum]